MRLRVQSYRDDEGALGCTNRTQESTKMVGANLPRVVCSFHVDTCSTTCASTPRPLLLPFYLFFFSFIHCSWLTEESVPLFFFSLASRVQLHSFFFHWCTQLMSYIGWVGRKYDTKGWEMSNCYLKIGLGYFLICEHFSTFRIVWICELLNHRRST